MQLPHFEQLSIRDLTQALFERTIALLQREDGWTQGASVRPPNTQEYHRYCLIGAHRRAIVEIRNLYGYDGRYNEKLSTAETTVYYKIADCIPSRNPIGWNDTKHRLQAEVVDKVKEAYEGWRAR